MSLKKSLTNFVPAPSTIGNGSGTLQPAPALRVPAVLAVPITTLVNNYE